jgi:elongation factor Ts
MDQMTAIKTLREMTSAPMAEVRKALVQSEWDMEKALDLIKARGLQLAKNAETREATEGAIKVLLHADTNRSLGVVVEVNSSTDFTSRSPEFQSFATTVVNQMLTSAVADFANASPTNETIETFRQELMAKTKENIQIRHFAAEEVVGDNRTVLSYVHSNDKIGVLASFEVPNSTHLTNPAFKKVADDVCMQIAAMSPLAVSREKLSEEVIERQKGIFKTQLQELKKPESSWNKIMEGKLNKWMSEVCLLEQESVIVPKQTVGAVLDTVSQDLTGTIGLVKVLNFTRFAVGEGQTKQETDFAKEVEELAGVHQHTRFTKGNECLDCGEVVKLEN